MRALVELALTAGRGPVSAAFIAKRQDLSVAYLEQLLHRLKKHGLIRSIRGPRGGYLLAADPKQITMADVVRVLDGSNGTWYGQEGAARESRANLRRAGRNGPSRAGSPRAEARDSRRYAQRIAQVIWRCVHERLTQSLGAVTLQDLCDEVRALNGDPIDHRYVFHI